MKIPGLETAWGYAIRKMPLALVLGFFAWLLWNKVERQDARIDALNTDFIEVLREQLDANQAAMSRNSDIMLKNSEATTNFSIYLNQKRKSP